MRYLVLISTLLLFACEEEEKGTTIRGIVELENSGEVTDSLVALIIGSDDRFPGQTTVADSMVTLDENMRFEVSFPYIEKLDYFSVGVRFIENNIVVDAINPSNLDCSPYDCTELLPGKTYDLTIRIPENAP